MYIYDKSVSHHFCYSLLGPVISLVQLSVYFYRVYKLNKLILHQLDFDSLTETKN
jgi:hypothetical protein